MEGDQIITSYLIVEVGIQALLPGQSSAHAQSLVRPDAMMAVPDQHWLDDTKVVSTWQYVNDGSLPANPAPTFDCSPPLRLYVPRKLWNMSGENGRGN